MFEIKYYSETLDTSEDFDDAVIKAEDILNEGQISSIYIINTGSDTRFDPDDWRGDGIGWNSHIQEALR